MASARPLFELLADVDGARLDSGSANTLVGGVSHDSRTISPGELFVAVPGLDHDGLQFIPDALARGAAAIVAERLSSAGSPSSAERLSSAGSSRGEAPRRIQEDS